MKKTFKIAIADDQLLFRKGLLAMLKDFPEANIVIEAADGDELLEEMKKKKVDVVLLDLKMPKMDGFEVTEKINKKYPDVKIIILTSHNEESFIHHLIKKGAHGFIIKDQDIEIIVDAIYGVMGNGYYFNDRVSRAMVKGLIESDKIRPTFKKINLSQRELEIIKLMSKEYTAREIAEKLFISERTVDGHRERILEKTKARNTVGIVMYAVKHHLLDL
jgi:DNA-binding NarL/FixJ family response regulator